MFTATRRLNVLASHVSRTSPTQTHSSRPTLLASAKVGAAFSSSAPSPAAMASAKQLVDSAIKDNDVLVFSKSYCPYCRRAKSILSELTDNAKVFELDERDDGADIQAYLKTLNGQGTVPHVYIKQDFIGGCSELQSIPPAQLKKRITA